MFLCSREDFSSFSKSNKSLLMANFYKQQRKKLNILIDQQGKPEGGKWSFDENNRKKLPKNQFPPGIKKTKIDKHTQSIIEVVDKHFVDHPGKTSDFWLPTSRKGAEQHFDRFLKERFENFGTYEDAIAPHSDFAYHSVLTPFLNTGLLCPADIIERTLSYAKKNNIPLNSLEGFIRQIIGWREFVRGIYQVHSEIQSSSNFWKHNKKLSKHWYEANTGITPLDEVLKKLLRTSYNHHIERLMIIGNMMLLLEIDPKEAHDWFMEMYIDSSEWVMGPNVYGMALFSDGGLFATKPYICGSNYWKKMGANMNGDWQDAVDGLYWSFIEKNRTFFAKNHRLNMMLRMLDKMNIEKKERIFNAADKLRKKLTK
jgi:deoxyribodipyrimidine photolyase-related protein